MRKRPRFPHLYHYVSERWLREIYQQAQPPHSKVDVTTDIGLKIPIADFRVAVSRSDQASKSRYESAELVFQILDRSHKLDPPNLTGNDSFVHAELELTLAQLPVMGLKDPIAWMYAVYDDPVLGHTFISLCGSIHNYIGFAGVDIEDQAIGGWFPSSSAGLHAIIERLSGEKGDHWEKGEWGRLTQDPGGLFDFLSALTHIENIWIVQKAYVEILAKIFFSAKDVQLQGGRLSGHFDTLLAGAPIWVRSA